MKKLLSIQGALICGEQLNKYLNLDYLDYKSIRVGGCEEAVNKIVENEFEIIACVIEENNDQIDWFLKMMKNNFFEIPILLIGEDAVIKRVEAEKK